jgi:hypothetical protein
MPTPLKFSAGQKFGRLTVIRRGVNKGPYQTYVCRCECGAITSPKARALKSGRTASCGCLHREKAAIQAAQMRRVKHGHSYESGFQSWYQMIQRCHRPTSTSYKNYGARGIAVCDRWRESYENFKNDMGERPSPGHSLDRIDNDGNYEPGNCRWATRKEQSRNTRVNRIITFNGRSLPLCDWPEVCGIPLGTIDNRLRKGWPVELALTAKRNAKLRTLLRS